MQFEGKESQSCKSRKEHKKYRSQFLSNLFTILETRQYREFISWSEDGRSFIIYDPEQLAQIVLPRYFKHSNFSSFTRQLHMYNINSVKLNNYGTGVRCFNHPLLVQGRRDLVQLIERKIAKNGKNDNNKKETQEILSTDLEKSKQESNWDSSQGDQEREQLCQLDGLNMRRKLVPNSETTVNLVSEELKLLSDRIAKIENNCVRSQGIRDEWAIHSENCKIRINMSENYQQTLYKSETSFTRFKLALEKFLNFDESDQDFQSSPEPFNKDSSPTEFELNFFDDLF